MTTPTETAVTPDLYWEARGSGPVILLIPGTPGDGGQFAALAEELASDHLVITYDRRGTSRSPRPKDWAETSVAEQADDAAAVLSRVGVGAAVVYGTSNGGAIALELALRHPGRVRSAIVHELPLLSVLEDPLPVASVLGSMIGSAMEAGGPGAALDAFLRFAYGDDVVAGWPVELRGRMLANAEMVFSVEMPAFQAYKPDSELLERCEVPVEILVGEEQHLPFFSESARWLARAVRSEVRVAPGGHGVHFSAPAKLAAAIRSIEKAG